MSPYVFRGFDHTLITRRRRIAGHKNGRRSGRFFGLYTFSRPSAALPEGITASSTEPPRGGIIPRRLTPRMRLRGTGQFVASGFPLSRMLLRDDNISGQPSTDPV